MVQGRFAKTGEKKFNAEIQQCSLAGKTGTNQTMYMQVKQSQPIESVQSVWEEKEPRASTVSNITLCIWG